MFNWEKYITIYRQSIIWKKNMVRISWYWNIESRYLDSKAMEVVRLFNVKKTKEYEKMVLENNVQKILFRQLDNFWDGWNKEVISIKISQARVRTKFWTTIGLRKEPFYVFKWTKGYCTTDISSNRVCNWGSILKFV